MRPLSLRDRAARRAVRSLVLYAGAIVAALLLLTACGREAPGEPQACTADNAIATHRVPNVSATGSVSDSTTVFYCEYGYRPISRPVRP